MIMDSDGKGKAKSLNGSSSVILCNHLQFLLVFKILSSETVQTMKCNTFVWKEKILVHQWNIKWTIKHYQSCDCSKFTFGRCIDFIKMHLLVTGQLFK